MHSISPLPSLLPIALPAWLIGMTLFTWAIYRLDKRRAQQGRRRIPEKTLLQLALFGGVIGALLGVYASRYRHKARKPSFMVPLYGIVLLYLAGAALLLYRAHGIFT